MPVTICDYWQLIMKGGVANESNPFTKCMCIIKLTLFGDVCNESSHDFIGAINIVHYDCGR